MALINPGPPGTCGAVCTVELQHELANYYDVQHIFVEEKTLCAQADWGGELVTPVPFTIKKVRHWQVHRRMPDFDLYHYMSQRNLGLLHHGREPGVLTCHGLAPLKADDVYTRGTRRRFQKQMRYIDRVAAVIANSKDTAGDLMQILNVPAGKITVIYFGVNHDQFKHRPAAEAREKLGIPPEALTILNVGTERKNKNTERLLAVFATLAREFDNLYLVRVGDRDDYFTSALEKSGLAQRVVRPGRVVNPAPYYNAADLYLCMDLHASFGMPNIEAMASGCPVVSSGVEAIPEIVGDACQLVDPRNVEMVTAVVREVLSSTSVQDELRGRGLKRAALFRWDRAAKQTAEVYSRVLKKG